MRKFSNGMHRASMSELNITPLLDLCFVLLIIFMITTPLMEQKMDVNLPHSRPNPQQFDSKKVRQVAVDASGRVFLDKKPVSVEELEKYLTAASKQDPDTVVALRADADLRYQQIVTVLDAIRHSGVKLGLSTVPEKKR